MVTRGREVKGIHRNWMSRVIISISVIRVQTVFGSVISVPDRCLVQL